MPRDRVSQSSHGGLLFEFPNGIGVHVYREAANHTGAIMVCDASGLICTRRYNGRNKQDACGLSATDIMAVLNWAQAGAKLEDSPYWKKHGDEPPFGEVDLLVYPGIAPFEVGDLVRVARGLATGYYGSLFVGTDMRKYRGRIAHVVDVYSSFGDESYYKLDIDEGQYHWPYKVLSYATEGESDDLLNEGLVAGQIVYVRPDLKVGMKYSNPSWPCTAAQVKEAGLKAYIQRVYQNDQYYASFSENASEVWCVDEFVNPIPQSYEVGDLVVVRSDSGMGEYAGAWFPQELAPFAGCVGRVESKLDGTRYLLDLSKDVAFPVQHLRPTEVVAEQFQVGSVVRVKDDLVAGVHSDGVAIGAAMLECMGRRTIITSTYKHGGADRCKIAADNGSHGWTTGMLEPDEVK